MADTGNPAESRRPRPEELPPDPRSSAYKAALAARYPSWGIATLALLVTGLVVGYLGMSPIGSAQQCAADPGLLICAPREHPVVVALPVAGLVLGLWGSLKGGLLIARRGRSPVRAAVAGWVVFALSLVASLVVAYLR
jgi:type VI protein secretion system component VasF